MVFGVCLVKEIVQNKSQIPYTISLAIISLIYVVVSFYLFVQSHAAKMWIEWIEVPNYYRLQNLTRVIMLLELFKEEVYYL